VGRVNLRTATNRPRAPQNPWLNALHTLNAHPVALVDYCRWSPESKIAAAVHRAWYLPTVCSPIFAGTGNLPARCDA